MFFFTVPTGIKQRFAHKEPCYHLCMHIHKRILLLSVSSLLLLSPLLTSADTVAKGARGPAVLEIQQQLVSAGFLAADNVTGYFGNLTRAAVVALQRAYNLETVGFVGHLTRAALTAAAGGSTIKPHGKPADTTPPSIPTNLSATAVLSTQINLAWTASTDNKGVVGYRVFRNGVQTSGTPTTNSYSDTGLTASTAYTYTVQAVDAAGNVSAQSAPASATTLPAGTLDTTAPSTPTNLTATAISSTQINLAWTASTDNVGVTGYKVFRGGTQVGTAATNSYSNTGLTASTAYTYTVSAYDAAGNNSAQSASASATTQSASTNTVYGGVIVAPYPTSATSTNLAPAIADLQKYLQQMDGVWDPVITGTPPPTGPSGYTFCANEYGTCSFSGSVSVAYGANGTFFYKTFTDGTLCNYTIFGDPLPGVTKWCFIPGTPPPPYTGIPASSIALLLSTSPDAPADTVTLLQGKSPEAFYIRGDGTSLKIIANDERGLSDGIYYYLEQLGVRWLLQGSNWNIVPTKTNVTLTIDKLVAPAYSIGHSMGPTGASYVDWPDRTVFDDWGRRLRAREWSQGGDVVDGYVWENWQYLQYHPDYFAKIDGVYSPLFTAGTGGNFNYNSSTGSYVQVTAGTGSYSLNAPKLNAGNPTGVNYFCTWVVNKYKALRSSPGGSAIKWASVETSDGYGYANNYTELQAAGVGNGSASDQTFYIADQCAKLIKTAYSDASVILLAYAGHADPPSFSLEPNVIVQMAPYKFQNSYAPEDFITAWQAKASTLAIYDYWLIPVWSPDTPHMDYLNQATKLRFLYNNNIRGLYDETTQGAGPMGIAHYVSEHIMWDPTLDDKAIIDEWYTLAFGPAKAPMKDMMERWEVAYLPTDIDFAHSYQDINQAEQLAAGNPAVQARVDDWARYLRYLQLAYETSKATAGTTLRAQLADALATHIFDIESSRMVYTAYMYDWAAGEDPSVKTLFSPSDHTGTGWASVHDLSHSEIMTIIANGISAYPASDVTANKNYTGPLVPLNPVTWVAPPTTDPWGPPVTIRVSISQGMEPSYIDFEIPTGLTHLPLQVVACEPPVTLAVFDGSMRNIYSTTVNPIATTTTNIWDKCGGTNDEKVWQNVDIPLAAGHYQLRVIGGLRLRTWKGVPLSWRHIGGGVFDYNTQPRERYYFYVPLGTQKIAFYRDQNITNLIYNNGITIYVPIIYDPSGNVVTQDVRDQGQVLVETVAPGQDGKIWSVQDLSTLTMINMPQSFGLEPGSLLVPSDAK